ncbi:MAG: homoserine dehydrogenase [Oceanicaulis sp.]
MADTALAPRFRLLEQTPAPRPARMRAVLLGCGVVNGGLEGLIPPQIEIVGVLARRARPEGIFGAPVFTDADAVFALNPDLVIEALPGGADAERLLERAVNARCHVVTANKDVAARRPDLARRLAEQGKTFACSAAVGGGAPVLETVDRLARSGAGLIRARGVLNGTSNFVLDRLLRGEALQTAVRAAQDAGFAEADPSADLDGLDAANKLALIARAAWGAELDPADIESRSITELTQAEIEAAREAGRVIRQVATVSRGPAGVRARVRLDALGVDDPLARTRDEGNCVTLTPNRGAPVIVAGKGAGRAPTAASVAGDLKRLCAAVCP